MISAMEKTTNQIYFVSINLFYKIPNIFSVKLCKFLNLKNIKTIFSGLNTRDIRLWSLHLFCNINLSQTGLFSSFYHSPDKKGVFLCPDSLTHIYYSVYTGSQYLKFRYGDKIQGASPTPENPFPFRKKTPARKSETSKEIFWCGNAETLRRWAEFVSVGTVSERTS